MPKTSARYQSYVLDIFAPKEAVGGWEIHVWPPNRRPPVIMTPRASENEAIREALLVIDCLMHGGGQQAA